MDCPGFNPTLIPRRGYISIAPNLILTPIPRRGYIYIEKVSHELSALHLMQLGVLIPVLQRNGQKLFICYFSLDKKVTKKSRLRSLPDKTAVSPLKDLIVSPKVLWDKGCLLVGETANLFTLRSLFCYREACKAEGGKTPEGWNACSPGFQPGVKCIKNHQSCT